METMPVRAHSVTSFYPQIERWTVTDELDIACSYSIFDLALYRKLDAKWLFPQEKAASHASGSVNV
jgi:hypothetical protein